MSNSNRINEFSGSAPGQPENRLVAINSKAVRRVRYCLLNRSQQQYVVTQFLRKKGPRSIANSLGITEDAVWNLLHNRVAGPEAA